MRRAASWIFAIFSPLDHRVYSWCTCARLITALSLLTKQRKVCATIFQCARRMQHGPRPPLTQCRTAVCCKEPEWYPSCALDSGFLVASSALPLDWLPLGHRHPSPRPLHAHMHAKRYRTSSTPLYMEIFMHTQDTCPIFVLLCPCSIRYSFQTSINTPSSSLPLTWLSQFQFTYLVILLFIAVLAKCLHTNCIRDSI